MLRLKGTPGARAGGFDYLRHRLLPAVLILLAIQGGGVLGYVVIEGMSALDALYMTIITLSTVGFGEVQSLSDGGRVFTIFLIIGGVVTLGYAVAVGVEYLVGGHLASRFAQRRKEQALATLQHHFLVCGYGRVGQELAIDLREAGRDVVVIDPGEELIRQAEQDGFSVVSGDASSNEVLQSAAIQRAAGVMVVTGSDAENVYIVMAARVLAPAVPVVARASSGEAIERLRTAGAARVFSPHTEGAQAIASYTLQPHVADVIQELVDPKSKAITIRDALIAPQSPFDQLTIQELDERFGAALREVSVLGIARDMDVSVVPPSSARVEAGDVLILVGRPEHVQRAIEASRASVGASAASGRAS